MWSIVNLPKPQVEHVKKAVDTNDKEDRTRYADKISKLQESHMHVRALIVLSMNLVDEVLSQ